MEVLSQILETLMAILSGWLVLMLVYQLVITFFGYKRNTKDYQDHAPLMRFLVLVPAHNEEAVIGDIVQNLNEMDYPRELYDFYILADNCTDRTAEIARGLGAQGAGKPPRTAPTRPPASPSCCKRRSTRWRATRTTMIWSCFSMRII